MSHLQHVKNALVARHTSQYSPRRSQLRLLKEFLRRELLWADHLGIRNASRRAADFYELAAAIAPNYEFPRDLLEVADAGLLSPAERACAGNALKWSFLLDVGPTRFNDLQLPAPYEPLIWFWRRGGRFTTEQGVWIDVPGLGGIRYDTFPNRIDLSEEIVELNEATLDQLDAINLPGTHGKRDCAGGV